MLLVCFSCLLMLPIFIFTMVFTPSCCNFKSLWIYYQIALVLSIKSNLSENLDYKVDINSMHSRISYSSLSLMYYRVFHVKVSVLGSVLMNLKIVYGFQHVPKVIAFDCWPLDLIKSLSSTASVLKHSRISLGITSFYSKIFFIKTNWS